MQILPLICLMCIALNQTRLVVSEALSPWSGGGFGMFSTTDAGSDRHLHVYELTPAFRRELALPPELDDDVRRVLTLPSNGQLRRLATLLAERLTPAPTGGIEIQVWSNRYDAADLRPQSRLLRAYRADDAARR